jgi:hypothetical protein
MCGLQVKPVPHLSARDGTVFRYEVSPEVSPKNSADHVPDLHTFLFVSGDTSGILLRHPQDPKPGGFTVRRTQTNSGSLDEFGCHEWSSRSSLIASSHRARVKSASLILPNR